MTTFTLTAPRHVAVDLKDWLWCFVGESGKSPVTLAALDAAEAVDLALWTEVVHENIRPLAPEPVAAGTQGRLF